MHTNPFTCTTKTRTLGVGDVLVLRSVYQRLGVIVARNQYRTTMGLALSLLFASVSLGCESTSSNGEEGTASCARRVEFNGRTYFDVGSVDLKPGAKLGTVQFLTCNDTGPQEQDNNVETKPEEVTAYEVKGIDSKVGLAIGDSRDNLDLFAIKQENAELPPEIKKFVDQSPRHNRGPNAAATVATQI